LVEAQKLESLGVLAGGIAHDFNNLLSSVIGNAELADRQLAPGSPARRHIEATLKASQRAAALVRRLLSYAGQGAQERLPVDLGAQVREALELIEPNVPGDVRLEVDLAERLPSVQGDRLQLQQVIVNLLLNAVESLEEHGGVVRVRTRRSGRPGAGVLPLETYLASHAEAHVVLEVADDGPGMDAATQARIFEPFYSTRFAGRGLGLASVLGIVRAHEGQVAVDSAPGRGACFRVWLPASPAEEVAAAPSQARALVLDDEPAVREVTAGMLLARGYEVLQADDLAAAQARLVDPDAPCDVAVLDLGLLGHAAGAALRRLRERAPRTALLLMSGYGEPEALRRVEGQAPDGFLRKPFGADALGRAVRAAVDAAGRARPAAEGD
jgi:CheY-like chemotaxis protein